MTSQEIKLNYEMAEDMRKAFQDGVTKLQETMHEMQSVANLMSDSALKGRAGNAYVEAIRNRLCPSLSKLIDKFQELDGDIAAAVSAMQEADQAAVNQFQSNSV
ncbi:MAG: hypothetical protein EI684_17115 [Candidatus Viridilinea halotolerans]|uniref:WXG100 family type VII secretion target n=1 Tax=Candidatus Viridilinea halotolerans TaxID=2491704 RepID=A0A426TUD0_9CHLR|nr:MAG: hypothetical protein EI684_17115 [Candidatus Viridilinea halotolerans]